MPTFIATTCFLGATAFLAVGCIQQGPGFEFAVYDVLRVIVFGEILQPGVIDYDYDYDCSSIGRF